MAALDQVLKDLAASADTGADKIERLSRAMEGLKKAGKSSTTPEEIVALNKLSKLYDQHISTLKKYEKAKDDANNKQADNQELTQKEIKNLEELSKAKKREEDDIKRVGNAYSRSEKERKAAIDAYEADTIKLFKTHTIVGKGVSAFSSEFVGLAG